jgi:hypothetical protein
VDELGARQPQVSNEYLWRLELEEDLAISHSERKRIQEIKIYIEEREDE